MGCHAEIRFDQEADGLEGELTDTELELLTAAFATRRSG